MFRATRPALQVQRELLAALETAQGPAARETLRAEASLASLVRDRGDSEQSMAMLAGVIAEAPWSEAKRAVALLFVELLQAQPGRQAR